MRTVGALLLCVAGACAPPLTYAQGHSGGGGGGHSGGGSGGHSGGGGGGHSGGGGGGHFAGGSHFGGGGHFSGGGGPPGGRPLSRGERGGRPPPRCPGPFRGPVSPPPRPPGPPTRRCWGGGPP